MYIAREYFYEEVLMEELKLHSLSTKLGKIILQIYNAISNMDNAEEYESTLDALKQMRLEILMLEKKYYNKELSLEKLKAYCNMYGKGLVKVKKELSDVENKKIKYSLDKIDNLLKKIKKIKDCID